MPADSWLSRLRALLGLQPEAVSPPLSLSWESVLLWAKPSATRRVRAMQLSLPGVRPTHLSPLVRVIRAAIRPGRVIELAQRTRWQVRLYI